MMLSRTRIFAALRFLREYQQVLEAELGELPALDEFRNAFFIGVVFPDLAQLAGLRRSVTHDDPFALACAACGEPAAVDAAECGGCKRAFYKVCVRGRRAADVADALAAVRRAAIRLEAERRRTAPPPYGGRVCPALFAGDKLPVANALRLDKGFFEDLKTLPADRYAAGGVEPLADVTREQLGFLIGVTQHLAFDRLLEAEGDARAAASREALAGELIRDRLREIAARLRLWAGSAQAMKGVKQIAWALLARLPEDLLPVSPDEKVDAKNLVQERFPEYVRTVAGGLEEPVAGGGADLTAERLEAAVRPVHRETIRLISEGYPASFGSLKTTLAQIAYPAPRPADLGLYLLETGAPLRLAEGDGSDWQRSYEKSGEPGDAKDADPNALGAFTDAELVHFIVVHALGAPDEATTKARERIEKEMAARRAATPPPPPRADQRLRHGEPAVASSSAEPTAASPAAAAPTPPPPPAFEMLGSRKGHYILLDREASNAYSAQPSDLAFFHDGERPSLAAVVLADGGCLHADASGLAAAPASSFLKPAGPHEWVRFARYVRP